MDIRKADSKGRVMIGDPGRVYEIIRKQSGHLELWPVYTKAEVMGVATTESGDY